MVLGNVDTIDHGVATADSPAAQAGVAQVLYFARVAEVVGQRSEQWPLSGPVTVADWLAQLVRRVPSLAPAERLRVAVNQRHAGADDWIRPGDEVAVFDPVTGG